MSHLYKEDLTLHTSTSKNSFLCLLLPILLLRACLYFPSSYNKYSALCCVNTFMYDCVA